MDFKPKPSDSFKTSENINNNICSTPKTFGADKNANADIPQSKTNLDKISENKNLLDERSTPLLDDNFEQDKNASFGNSAQDEQQNKALFGPQQDADSAEYEIQGIIYAEERKETGVETYANPLSKTPVKQEVTEGENFKMQDNFNRKNTKTKQIHSLTNSRDKSMNYKEQDSCSLGDKIKKQEEQNPETPKSTGLTGETFHTDTIVTIDSVKLKRLYGSDNDETRPNDGMSMKDEELDDFNYLKDGLSQYPFKDLEENADQVKKESPEKTTGKEQADNEKEDKIELSETGHNKNENGESYFADTAQMKNQVVRDYISERSDSTELPKKEKSPGAEICDNVEESEKIQQVFKADLIVQNDEKTYLPEEAQLKDREELVAPDFPEDNETVQEEKTEQSKSDETEIDDHGQNLSDGKTTSIDIVEDLGKQKGQIEETTGESEKIKLLKNSINVHETNKIIMPQNNGSNATNTGPIKTKKELIFFKQPDETSEDRENIDIIFDQLGDNDSDLHDEDEEDYGVVFETDPEPEQTYHVEEKRIKIIKDSQ